MKTLRIVSLFVLLIASNAGCLFAGNLYVIITADVNNGNGSAAFKKDLENFTAFSRTVADACGHTLQLKVITEYNQTGANELMSYLNNLNETAEDQIMVFNTSHGINYDNHSAINMGVNVKLTDVANRIKRRAKNSLILFNNCNHLSGISIPTTQLSTALQTKIARLFNEKFQLKMSSSTRGELSYGRDNVGGFFSYSFITAFEEIMTSNREATWENIIALAKEKTVVMARQANVTQNPYCEIIRVGETQQTQAPRLNNTKGEVGSGDATFE